MKRNTVAAVLFSFIGLQSCFSEREIDLPGSARYIYREGDSMVVGYRDDQDFIFYTQSIEITPKEIVLGEKIAGRDKFIEYSKLWRTAAEERLNKYGDVSRSIESHNELFLFNDPLERNSVLVLSYIDEFADLLLLLYNWDDGHARVASQIIVADQSGGIIANKSIDTGGRRPYSRSHIAGFVDESTIYFDYSYWGEGYHALEQIVVRRIEELPDVNP